MSNSYSNEAVTVSASFVTELGMDKLPLRVSDYAVTISTNFPHIANGFGLGKPFLKS